MSRASSIAPNAECLTALVVLDALVPERRFYGTLAGRSTFKSWERGVTIRGGELSRLQIYQVPGIGRAIRPSNLKAFLDSIASLKGPPSDGVLR